MIELLVAIAVIGIGAIALIAGFGTAIGGSVEHRSLSSLDTVLRSFAETAKFQIQQQASPLFSNCATDYTLASVPTPTNGALGSAVTVFGTGFTPGSAITVTLGSTVVETIPATGNPDGDVTATFAVPSSGFLVGTPYPIKLTDGSVTATSATPFTVRSGTPVTSSALSGYSLDITQIQTWNPQASPAPAFQVSPCAPSGIQLMTFTGTAPNNVTDSTSIVLINPSFVVTAFTPTVAVTATPTGAYATQTVTFTATVSGPANAPTRPMGDLNWSLSGPGSPTCSTSSLIQNPDPNSVNSSIATCVLENTQASPPNYSATANYVGDINYVAASGTGVVAVQGLTAAIAVDSTPANITPGSTLTFTATVTGPNGQPAPTGSVVWGLSGPGTPPPSCPDSVLTPGSGHSSTATCVVTGAPRGSYVVAPAYSGDMYYSPTTGSGSAAVPTGASVTVSAPPGATTGSSVTVTATVSAPSGAATPTGTVVWNFSPGSPTCSSSTPLTANGGSSSTATCLLTNVSTPGYMATVNYSGDTTYGATTGTGSIVVGKASPTVNVTPSPTSPAPGSTITFTAVVAGPPAAVAPTGSVTWTITGPPTSPTCSALLPVAGTTNSSYATCTVTSAVAGSYNATPTYGGDSNYATVSGSGSVVVANPPLNVTAVVPHDGGGTPGLLEVGDSLSITFSNALNENTIPTPQTLTTPGTPVTVTLCSNQANCSAQGSTNISISGVAGLTVGTNYVQDGKTVSATGTLALSGDKKTVTLTITQLPNGSSHLRAGTSVTFTFVASTTIRDVNGTSPNSAGYVFSPPSLPSNSQTVLW